MYLMHEVLKAAFDLYYNFHLPKIRKTFCFMMYCKLHKILFTFFLLYFD